MRQGINQWFRQYYRLRMQASERRYRDPWLLQEHWRKEIVAQGRHTLFGKQYHLGEVKDSRDFAQAVPITDYEDLKPAIHRMMAGEADVLWPGKIRWFARSSGTTQDKSKYIPVSEENRRRCHLQGTWDTMMYFYHHVPDALPFRDKTLLMGGSLLRLPEYPRAIIGDISAIMIRHLPWVARPFFGPDLRTALMADWEEKISRIARYAAKRSDIVMVGGVPTWSLLLFQHILELSGREHLRDLWPHFQLYTHGGVSFTPYREQFQALFPGHGVHFVETYNASEGFFAVQDRPDEEGMRLLLDNGVYYEFIPRGHDGGFNAPAIPLDQVACEVDYALIITTNSGLWRYRIGDTVQFIDKNPYRIRVTGRIQQFINTFGEEVMVENTDRALALTCQEFGVSVREYTVAPRFISNGKKGGHEWAVEFAKAPDDLTAFSLSLDRHLQAQNSDYEAKRSGDLALDNLQLHSVRQGTFYGWLRSRNRYGNQAKVPRLASHRRVLEEILAIAGS